MGIGEREHAADRRRMDPKHGGTAAMAGDAARSRNLIQGGRHQPWRGEQGRLDQAMFSATGPAN